VQLEDDAVVMGISGGGGRVKVVRKPGGPGSNVGKRPCAQRGRSQLRFKIPECIASAATTVPRHRRAHRKLAC
jgi:hypothetical protein